MQADIVIKSTSIFDSVREIPYEGFVAVCGKKIIAVVEGKDYSPYLGENTKVIDAGDKTVMAGFHDSHTHLIMAGLFKKYANLDGAKSAGEAAKQLWDENPVDDGKWKIGFRWYHVFWDKPELPTKEILDKYYKNSPVCLINAEAHGAWVNSKALELAGITEETKNPIGGEIFRDENGEATGFLNESAAGMVTKLAFDFTEKEEGEIIKTFMEDAGKLGITSINDVQPYFHGNMGNLSTYSMLDKSDELTIRINVAPNLLGDLDEVMEWGKAYNSEKIRVSMVKQFLDGVCTTHTALVLDDYTDEPGNKGIAISDNEAIGKAVPEAHKRGLSIKLHSCGDRSARMALDFYEEALNKYGDTGARHAIEHIEMIDEKDLIRIKELKVVPSMQPEHLALTEKYEDNPYPVVLGEERASRCWPNKSLYDMAGYLAFGSDCPVVDNNPFLEIYRAVTRKHNDLMPENGWTPSERLSRYEAFRSYTYGSAYGARREAELGTLEKGKFADIVILDCNAFEVSDEELKEANVLMTIMDGKTVYCK